MSQTYPDPANQIISQLPPGAAVPNTNSSSGGVMNWIKANKLWVAIGILVLIALIWFFCIRKKGTPNTEIVVTNPTPVDGAVPSTSEIKITKMRPGAMF